MMPLPRLEISWGPPERGPVSSRTYPAPCISEATGFAAWINEKGCNVYIGATLKHPDTPEKGRTDGRHAYSAECLPIDIDADFLAVADRAGRLARPQLIVITGQTPATRGQLFVKVKPTGDFAAWDDLHSRIVKRCGADENALGRNRLVRLAGTISYPSPAKVARGYVTELTSATFIPAPRYTVEDLLAIVPPVAPSARPAPPTFNLGLVPNLPLGRRTRPTIGVVEAALGAVPDCYGVEQRLWLKVGFALFDYDPHELGLDLWQRFSRRCPEKAGLTDFPKLWSGFARPYLGRRITIDWLLREARRPHHPPIGHKRA